MNKNRAIPNTLKKYLQKYIDMPGVTEICYNGRKDLLVLTNKGWVSYETEMDHDTAYSFAQAVAASLDKIVEIKEPILSAHLPNGERIQIVLPPTTKKGTVCFSIRVPSKVRFTLDDYREQGLFDNIKEKSTAEKSNSDIELIELLKNKEYEAFIKLAIKYEKTIIFAGETGSGKTTFVKTLIDFIPTNKRLISIEDTAEIDFINHNNSVNLYYPDTAKEGDAVTSSKLIRACLRLRPDIILLTEVRDGAAYDFIDAVRSGHKGSITSLHADTSERAFARLIDMYKSHPIGLVKPYDVIDKEIKELIDIVICMSQDIETGKRSITEIYFKEVHHA